MSLSDTVPHSVQQHDPTTEPYYANIWEGKKAYNAMNENILIQEWLEKRRPKATKHSLTLTNDGAKEWRQKLKTKDNSKPPDQHLKSLFKD
jgi:hypothetical protein